MSDSDERPRLEINWVQSTGGALAAVSSAVLLSTFGVAGTLIGAALGSLVITVGGAIYSYSIRATRQRVAMAQTVAATRIGLAQARGRVREASEGIAERTPRVADEADEDLAEAEADLDRAFAGLQEGPKVADARLDWRSVLGGLPWKRIAAVATAIFVAAMLVILAFELITGRAVSSYTGGSDPDRRTSIPGLGGASDSESDQPEEQQPGDPADEETPPPDDEPTVEPTVEPTEPAPSETVDPEPTEAPTTEPTPAP